jgi:flagellar biosynthesis protein FlhG
MVILPIGSGKGGVGKSLLATNLSIALAEAGRRVVLADLDLGASNLHTMLGLRSVDRGIGTFLTASKVPLSDIVLPTEYEGLSFIPGDAEIPGIANLKSAQKKRLVRNLLSLDADYLVLDLGAGTSANTLDFFLLSRTGIVITTPSLTAILNAYLFLKNAVFRVMYSTFDKES